MEPDPNSATPVQPRPARKSGPLSPDALDFAPGLLSIQEAPPARLPRAVLITVVTLFAILLTWAIFGRLDIVASAEGRLVPQTYVKIVQPADAGIVADILVKEGQAVHAGQVLMRMDTQLAKADAATIRNELLLKSLQLRRIDAELSGTSIKNRRDDPPLLRAQIENQYRAHRQAYFDSVAEVRAALEKAKQDLASAEQVREKLKQVLPTYTKSALAYERLAKEGFVGALAVQEKERDRIEKAQDLKAQEANVLSLKATIAAAEKRLAQITSNYDSQLQNERVETASQHQKLEQEWAKSAHKTGLLELKATQDGIVKDLATHTRGTVVSPGTVLLTLVPQDEPLQAEISIRNDDVGFVYPDQQVKIKLAAYPFQKYGMVDGRVIHVGADATDSTPSGRDGSSESTPAGALAYKALVKLSRQTLQTDDGPLRLTAGMRVVAEIHQGHRTVMEYLLSPLQKAFQEAGRER